MSHDKLNLNICNWTHSKTPERFGLVIKRGGQSMAVAQTSEAAPMHNGPAVVLRSCLEGPIVRGKEKKRLTVAQFNVVKSLIDAGRSLTKDELLSKSGHSDCLGILKRLAESDEDWKAVIHRAGITGGGYRIN